MLQVHYTIIVLETAACCRQWMLLNLNLIHSTEVRDNTLKIYGMTAQIYVFEWFEARTSLEKNLLVKELISSIQWMNLITMHLFKRKCCWRHLQYTAQWKVKEGWSLWKLWEWKKEGKLLRASLELKFNLKNYQKRNGEKMQTLKGFLRP